MVSSTRYFNRAACWHGRGGALAFGAIGLVASLASDAGADRMFYGLVFVLSMAVLLRTWSRPGLMLGSKVVRVEGHARTMTIAYDDVERFWTGPARVGAFMRIGLGADLKDGRQLDLSRWGSWVGEQSRDREMFLAVVRELNHRVGVAGA